MGIPTTNPDATPYSEEETNAGNKILSHFSFKMSQDITNDDSPISTKMENY